MASRLPDYTGATTVTPSRAEQTLATKNKSLTENVEIQGVTAAIDPHITPENIKEGVTILGVVGTMQTASKVYDGPTNVKPDVMPTTLETAGKNMPSDIKIKAVTAAIDADILPENIKEGVTILGVTGTCIETAVYDGPTTIQPSGATQILSTAGMNVEENIIISPITAEVDPNILPENIKEGVTILGVTGTCIETAVYDGPTTLTPDRQEAKSLATAGKNVESDIVVKAVTAAADPNIVPENIRDGVEVLGVVGNVVETAVYDGPTTLTPDRQEAKSLATAGKNVESDITVNAVTADIDIDIKPQNIATGTNVLGVEGTATLGNSGIFALGKLPQSALDAIDSIAISSHIGEDWQGAIRFDGDWVEKVEAELAGSKTPKRVMLNKPGGSEPFYFPTDWSDKGHGVNPIVFMRLGLDTRTSAEGGQSGAQLERAGFVFARKATPQSTDWAITPFKPPEDAPWGKVANADGYGRVIYIEEIIGDHITQAGMFNRFNNMGAGTIDLSGYWVNPDPAKDLPANDYMWWLLAGAKYWPNESYLSDVHFIFPKALETKTSNVAKGTYAGAGSTPVGTVQECLALFQNKEFVGKDLAKPPFLPWVYN